MRQLPACIFCTRWVSRTGSLLFRVWSLNMAGPKMKTPPEGGDKQESLTWPGLVSQNEESLLFVRLCRDN